MPTILHPESETVWRALRTHDVTSTESAALFGLSPYTTEFELWHRKKEAIEAAFEENERMLWGQRLQDAIARGIAEDYAVKVRKLTAYMRHNHVRMGASFDFEIVGTLSEAAPYNDLVANYEKSGAGILEVKNVDSLIFRDQWQVGEEGEIEAPAHIEVQIQHQLHVVDRDWGVIAALIGGNTPKLLFRHRDRAVGVAIENKIREFWASIEANAPPAPNFKDDAQFIAKLYGYAEPGKIVSAYDNQELASLCARYSELAAMEKNAKEEKQAVKAELLTKIGDAEKVFADGFTISAGVVGPMEKSYSQPAYRNFRVTPKKKAKAA